MEKSYEALRRDGKFVLNIDDVTIGGKTHPLYEVAVKKAKAAGFKPHSLDQYDLSYWVSSQEGKKVAVHRAERVFIMKK